MSRSIDARVDADVVDEPLKNASTKGAALTAPDDAPTSAMGAREYAIMVATGAFATTFAQNRVLAQLPTTFLLKEQFQFPKEQVALFMFWATFAWNVKPVAGIFTDAFPLFGTRRRHYMILGSIMAGLCWLLMGVVSSNYALLLAATIGMNIGTVFASTVMGGLMVEAGQRYGASGRISSLRQFVQNIAIVVGPLLGGYLAGRAYGWTAATGGLTVLALAACTMWFLREPPIDRTAHAQRGAAAAERQRPPLTLVLGLIATVALATWLLGFPELRNIALSLYALVFVFGLVIATAMTPATNPVIVGAQRQLGQIFRSQTLWMAAAMIFLVWAVPGYNTALIFQQSDVLHFKKEFIGVLTAVEGAAGIAAAVFYAFYCRKVTLQQLIYLSVGSYAAVTFLYLVYSESTAPLAHILTGFTQIMTDLALIDLAVRSTPRGCEALGFAVMMSVRNFGIAISDVVGSQMMDSFHVAFNNLILVNALTSAAVLVFTPLLPAAIVNRREGET